MPRSCPEAQAAVRLGLFDDDIDASSSSLSFIETTPLVDSIEQQSVWEDEPDNDSLPLRRRSSANKGTMPIDPNITPEEKFALEFLLGEAIADMPPEVSSYKRDSKVLSEGEKFALEVLLAPKPKKNRRKNKTWLTKCWRSLRTMSSSDTVGSKEADKAASD